jgi:hypothetical protein
MSERTPEEICTDLLGQTIESIEVNYDDEMFIITTNLGKIEFSGDGLEMYVESDKFDD